MREAKARVGRHPFWTVLRNVQHDVHLRTLGTNSGWVMASSLTVAGLAFLKSMLVARTLGVANYGMYCQVAALVATASEVANLNFGTPLTRYGAKMCAEGRLDKYAALLKGIAWGCFVTAVAGGGGGFVLVKWAYGDWLHQHHLAVPVAAFCLIETGVFLSFVCQSVLRLEDKFGLATTATALGAVLDFGVMVAALSTDGNPLVAFWFGLVVGRLGSTALMFAAAIGSARVGVRSILTTPLSALSGEWGAIGRFTLGNSLSRTVSTLLNRGDVLLLGALTNEQSVGLYAVAKKLAYTILVATDPLGNAAYPQMANMAAAGHYEDVRRMVLRLSGLVVLPVGGLLLALWLCAPAVLRVTFGPEYAAAAPMLCILVTGAALSAIFFWHIPLVQCLGLVRLRFWATVAALLVSLGVALTLIPVLGPSGTAIGILVANVVTVGSCSLAGVRLLQARARPT